MQRRLLKSVSVLIVLYLAILLVPEVAIASEASSMPVSDSAQMDIVDGSSVSVSDSVEDNATEVSDGLLGSEGTDSARGTDSDNAVIRSSGQGDSDGVDVRADEAAVLQQVDKASGLDRHAGVSSIAPSSSPEQSSAESAANTDQAPAVQEKGACPSFSSTGKELIPSAASKKPDSQAAPSISYNAHVQNLGWQGDRTSGSVGTERQALRMEALRIHLETGGYQGGLQMQAHVQDVGWTAVQHQDGMLGTTGKGRRLESVKLMLTGDISRYYDIRYRAHVQNIGWQGWVSNGGLAGTVGKGLRIEAFEITLKKKSAPQSNPAEGIVGVRYRTHVQNVGWQSSQAYGAVAGTTGQALRIEALRIALDPGSYSGGIEYRVHIQNAGWMPWVKANAQAGATGRALRVEAFQVRLTGDIAEKYDVVYAAHVQNIGWRYKRFNGATAGTTGRSLRVEALWIDVVSKSRRSGWYGSGTSWQYYRKGSPVAGQWLVTTESPIADNAGLQRYWIDTSGKLAVSRLVNPRTAVDRGSWVSYATSKGYVLRGKHPVSGGLMLADNDGLLCSSVGWLTTSKYDGSSQLYRMEGKGLYSIAKTGLFSVAGSRYYAWPQSGWVFRDATMKIEGSWYSAGRNGRLTPANLGAMINSYVRWAISIANDNSHGYSQVNRWGPDYDCSSLAISAVRSAGFYVGAADDTANMVAEMTKYGFTFHSNMSGLRSGDIVWVRNNRRHHTEIYIGGNQLVGATGDEYGGIAGRHAGDQTGREIRIRSYYDAPWMGFLRAE